MPSTASKRWLIKALFAVAVVAALPAAAEAAPAIIAVKAFLILHKIALITTAVTTGLSIGLQYLASRLRRQPHLSVRDQEINIITSRWGVPIERAYGRRVRVRGHVPELGTITKYYTGGVSGSKRRAPEPNRLKVGSNITAMFCENYDQATIRGIRRLFFEGKLVWENPEELLTGADSPAYTIPGVAGGAERFKYTLGLDSSVPPFNFTNPVAYRNRVVCWWGHLDFEPWFNRVPSQIDAEVETWAESVADVIRLECGRVGITPDQLELSAVQNDIIEGMVVPDSVTPKEVIEMLQSAYQFALIDNGAKLQAVKLPTAATVNVPLEDLEPVAAGIEDNPEYGPLMSRDVIARNEAPQRVEVICLNVTRGYEQMTQGYGLETHPSRGVTRFDMPVAFYPDQAHRIAKILAATAAAEGPLMKFTLPRKYLAITPGDTVAVTPPVGPACDVRVELTGIEGAGRIEITGTRQIAEAWVQDGHGSGGSLTGGIEDEVGTDPPPTATTVLLGSILWVWSTGILHDEHDLRNGFYYAVCPGPVPDPPWPPNPVFLWPGATVFQNLAGQAGELVDPNDPGGAEYPGEPVYEELGTFVSSAVMGHTVGIASGDPGDDITNIFTGALVDVQIYNGRQLSSISGDLFEVNTTENLCVIGDEVVQFKDAEPLGNGVYRLQGFIKRGLRGTENAIGTHQVGERFVLWDRATVFRKEINESDFGNTYSFRVRTVGEDIAEATTVHHQLLPH